MNEKLKQLIERAIREEQFFVDFYQQQADKTENPSLKKLFENLSAQEKQHKLKLENYDLINVKIIDEDQIASINLGEDIMLAPISEFKQIKEILNFAIKRENEAKETYAKLSESIEEGKELFGWLSREEEKHENLLKSELASLGI